VGANKALISAQNVCHRLQIITARCRLPPPTLPNRSHRPRKAPRLARHFSIKAIEKCVSYGVVILSGAHVGKRSRRICVVACPREDCFLLRLPSAPCRELPPAPAQWEMAIRTALRLARPSERERPCRVVEVNIGGTQKCCQTCHFASVKVSKRAKMCPKMAPQFSYSVVLK
jgi:hypothetical protein